MKINLLQITFFVFMSLFIANSCKNNIDTNNNIKPKYNADSLKKVSYYFQEKINDCIIKNEIDSVYDFALAYKNATINNDTAWAIKFIDIYTALDTAKKDKRIILLNNIIEKESSDNVFNVQKVKAICNLAYENENDPSSYVKILEKALTFKVALDSLGPDYKNFIYQNIGETYTKLNDNKTGIQYLKLFYNTSFRIKDIDHRNEQLSEAALGIGNTYRNMSEYDSAEYYCTIATQIPNVNRKSKALSNAALAEVYFEIKAISKAALPALIANELLKNDTTKQITKTKATILSILSEIELLKKNYKKATTYAQQSMQQYEKSNESTSREKAKLLLVFAQIQKEQNNNDSALYFLNKAIGSVINFTPKNLYDLPSIDSIRAENTIYEALDRKAAIFSEIAHTQNDNELLEKAIAAYSLSFSVENLLQQYFLNTAATNMQMQESRKRSEAAIQLCYELFSKTKNNIWAEKAFAFAEKNKAIVLLESIKRNILTNDVLKSDTNLNNSLRIQAEIAAAERDILETKEETIKQERRVIIEKLQTELLFAQTTLGNQNDFFKTIIQKEDTLSATVIANKLLGKETSIIEFFSTDSATFIFTITKNNPIKFYKTDTAINNAVNNFLYFFENKNNIGNNPVAYNSAAFSLYTKCGFSEINSSVDKLIIIPDGKFNFIPFEALTTSTNNTTNPKVFNYLLAQKQISYNYSCGIMLKQLENESKSSLNKIVAFAPVFENSHRNKSPLLNTADEIEAIKKANPSGNYFLKNNATLSNFKKEISTAGIVHIATHAQADVQNAQQPQIEFYDSALYLNELYAMHINPKLVVLSACETGKGEINKSEGAMSLARGFYYAGAKNIITSLWSVEDKSTANIFSNFYSNFSNTNYSESLQKAKLTYLQNATSTNASPYYWAGFIHIGYQPKKANHLPILLFVSLLFLFAITLYFLHKRNKANTK